MTAHLRSDFAGSARTATKSKPPRMVSVRVTHEERADLERRAGEQTVSAYVRAVLFDQASARRSHRKRPEIDRVALARILALLGQSELSANLRIIADAARTGTLEIGAALVEELGQACADVALMRADLIRALGIKAE